MTKLRLVFALAMAAFVAVALAACGDDAASDLEPAEVLEQTFSEDHELNSGLIGLTASVDVPGDQGGSGEFTAEVPFANNGEGEVPDLRMDVSADAEGAGESFEFSGGVTLTPEGAAVTVDDTSYEVPEEFFDAFAQMITQASEQNEEQATPSLEDLGFNPETWFTELTNEGSEDIDGAETVHVSGVLDFAAAGADILNAIQELGIPGTELPPGFDASQLGLIEGFIEEASFDVYSETDDYLLRRLDFTLALQNLAAASGGSGPDGASFEMSLTINEPNEEQDVALPEDAQTFEDLRARLREEYGFDIGELGALGALGGAGGLGALGGAGTGGEEPGVNQAYLECFENAGSPEALEKCAEEL